MTIPKQVHKPAAQSYDFAISLFLFKVKDPNKNSRKENWDPEITISFYLTLVH